MSKKKPVLLDRQRATQVCVDRYLGQPLDFKRHDCVRLARLALVKQGVKVGLLKGLRWGSYAGAVKALKASGFKDLIEGMDATGCPRIAPAMAWPGDIVALPSPEKDPFGCSLMIALENGRLLGLDGQGSFAVIQPAGLYVTAWRVSRG